MEQLKRLREARGLSQTKLAARADVNPATVNQIEGGKRSASPATLRKLAEALDVSLYELIEGEPRPLEQPRLPNVGEKRRGTVYRYPDEPKVTAEQLRARGIEVNDSEVIVLNQYLAIHENPPTGIHVIGHVKREGEPVDHERVRGILLYLIAKDLLPPEETEAVAENMRRELAGAGA